MSTSRNIDDINAVVQAQLRQLGIDEVSAVEAAQWLDAAGALGTATLGLVCHCEISCVQVESTARSNGRPGRTVAGTSLATLE